MRLTPVPGPIMARTRATPRSSRPQAAIGTSAYSLLNTVRPIFCTANTSPTTGITPIWQGPLSTGAVGLAPVLAFGGFLAAGLMVVPGVAAAPGAGWTWAHADIARHDNTHAVAKIRTMKTRVM